MTSVPVTPITPPVPFHARTRAHPPQQQETVFIVRPRGLGLGEDRIIGRSAGSSYRRIDLTRLSHPVRIDWSGPTSGVISDGADCILFHGIEEILLPACMMGDDALLPVA